MDFVYVGSFDYTGSEGIHICRYDRESGALEYVKTVFPEINTNCVNVVGDILYVTDEQAGEPGKGPGGGGRVYAFSIDPQTGDLTLISKKDTLGVNPSYITPDATGRYAFVTHFTVGDPVTKAVRDENGDFHAEVVQNDGITDLFRIEEDGSLGKLCDVFYHRDRENPSMIHKIFQVPGQNLYLECDLGGDWFYFLTIDYENEKLVKVSSCRACEDGRGPRHAAFHPSLKYLYLNYEHKGAVTRYDVTDLTDVHPVEEQWFVDDEDLEKEGHRGDNQSEILFSSDGKFLYTFMRGKGLAQVYRVDERTGAMTCIQNYRLPGNDPRGAAFSPDGRFIIVAGHYEDKVFTLRVLPDGTLNDTGLCCRMVKPSVLAFYSGHDKE